MSTEQQLTFDHADPAMKDRLHETYADFRAKCPVARGENFGGFWALTRYDDVLQAARDYKNFTVTKGITIPHINGATPVLPAQVDPPEHTGYRRLVQKFFTPTAMKPYEDILRDMTRRQLATIAAVGEADLVQVVARPIPPMAIAFMFGMPLDQSHRFADWADEMMRTAFNGDSDGHERVIDELEAFLEERCLEHRGRDDDTVLGAIANGTIDGRLLTSIEIRGLTHLLAIAGHETTVNSISSMLYNMFIRPELCDRLRADPDLIAPMVEEALRFDAPVMSMARTVVNEAELSGQALCPGDRVLLAYVSANRDGSAFARADEFVVPREDNNHLAFGAGTHRCLGEHLARIEMRVVAEEIIAHMPDVHLADGYVPDWHSARTARGVQTLPVVYTPWA